MEIMPSQKIDIGYLHHYLTACLIQIADGEHLTDNDYSIFIAFNNF